MNNDNGKLHMCQVCGKRPATVFIKNNINGKIIEKELCAECAAQLQGNGMLEDIFLNGVGGLFSSIMGMPYEEDERQQRRERACPNCGMTERQIRESYSFGCSECYKTFADLADEFVSKLGGSAHKGRTPKGYKGISDTSDAPVSTSGSGRKTQLTADEKIEELERRMREAASREDYDAALEYKKQIEELKRRG